MSRENLGGSFWLKAREEEGCWGGRDGGLLFIDYLGVRYLRFFSYDHDSIC